MIAVPTTSRGNAGETRAASSDETTSTNATATVLRTIATNRSLSKSRATPRARRRNRLSAGRNIAPEGARPFYHRFRTDGRYETRHCLDAGRAIRPSDLFGCLCALLRDDHVVDEPAGVRVRVAVFRVERESQLDRLARVGAERDRAAI